MMELHLPDTDILPLYSRLSAAERIEGRPRGRPFFLRLPYTLRVTSLLWITDTLLREISREARENPRRRKNRNFHEMSDPELAPPGQITPWRFGLASATGASGPRVLGALYPAR